MDCCSLLKRLLLCLLVVFALGVMPVQSQSCQFCVLVTDPHEAFSAGNGAAVNLNNCGLHVDSSSSTALLVTGGATVKAWRSMSRDGEHDGPGRCDQRRQPRCFYRGLQSSGSDRPCNSPCNNPRRPTRS